MIEIILNQFLLDILFIIRGASWSCRYADSHSIYGCFILSFNNSWCAFRSMSILQKHLLTGFNFLKDACCLIAILCIFFSCMIWRKRNKIKCMKRVDSNKEHFIWAKNDEDDEDEVWSSLDHCILLIVEWYWHFLKGIL